jgi:hypothetical protein
MIILQCDTPSSLDPPAAVFIFAGYEKPMDDFLNVNQVGLFSVKALFLYCIVTF